jgi:hypothetical protein
LAGSGNIGEDGSAEGIMCSCVSINSLPVVSGIVELLALDMKLLLIPNNCFIKSNVIGIVIKRRRL